MTHYLRVLPSCSKNLMVSLMLAEWWKILLIGMEAVKRKVANHLPVFILGFSEYAGRGREEWKGVP